MLEKRQHFRERLRKPIRVQVLSATAEPAVQTEARILDLSISGALLRTSIGLPAGASLELELPLAEAEAFASVKAEVIRCKAKEADGGFEVAIRFEQELPQVAWILAENILYTYKSVIHSQMN